MGVISGIIALFGWGIADFLAAITSRKLGNFSTLFWVQVIGFALATPYFLANFQAFDLISIIGVLPYLIGVAFFQTIAYLSFYKGLQTGLVSVVSPIGDSFSLITIMLSTLFLGERLTSFQIGAVILLIVSIVLTSTNLNELFETKKLSVLTGVKEGLIAMLAWGISLFLIVPASQVLGWFMPVYVFRFFMIVMLSLLIPLMYQKEFSIPDKKTFSKLLLPVGIFDLSAFFGYSLGVSSEAASLVAPVSSAFPMVAILLARLFLKEKLVLNQVTGVVGIVLGIILLSA
jgi:drug/metabolite transporter (DMT)-like permease